VAQFAGRKNSSTISGYAEVTGTDVGVTKDGKLTALYVFIDPPSQK
jgi:hypothetical protein